MYVQLKAFHHVILILYIIQHACTVGRWHFMQYQLKHPQLSTYSCFNMQIRSGSYFVQINVKVVGVYLSITMIAIEPTGIIHCTPTWWLFKFFGILKVACCGHTLQLQESVTSL